MAQDKKLTVSDCFRTCTQLAQTGQVMLNKLKDPKTNVEEVLEGHQRQYQRIIDGLLQINSTLHIKTRALETEMITDPWETPEAPEVEGSTEEEMTDEEKQREEESSGSSEG